MQHGKSYNICSIFDKHEINFMKNQYLIFIFVLFVNLNISAQEKEKDTLFDKESKTFMVLPLVTNSPAMKTGFGAMPMFFLN
jgi:hypothetical protein